MAEASRYSGLAGTILLGTLLGLNYSQYARRRSPLADKAGSFDPESETKPGSFYDKDGNLVPLGKTDLPGTSAVRRLRDFIPETSPLVLCAALSLLWAVRSFGAMNKVLNRRYSDIVYQIRRPDVIANRAIAWRHLGLGGLIVPCAFVSIVYWNYSEDSRLPHGASTMKDLSERVRSHGVISPLSIQRSGFSDSVAEFGKTLREGFKPI
jgi:hypothetical protein